MSSDSPTGTLGKYQIIREIARSNDIVYEAYDPLMNRRVALKELSMPTGSTDQQREERVKRFLREARAVGSLTHPNIMTVFEVGEEAGRRFIAMEYLDGHNLRNELDTNGLIPPDRALEITLKILAGLSYAHQHGVIHRDIKPDNIQLLADGRVKLTDFGIARLTFEPNLTMDGQVFGTPSYMSPEQVVGKEIDARSDLFSVAVLLYEMLSGKKPFPGDSVVAITYAIMNKEPEPLAGVNHTLEQLILKTLDKSPALRFASAEEMIRALEQAKATTNAVVLDPIPAPQRPQPAPPPMQYPYNPYGGQPTQYGPPQQPVYYPGQTYGQTYGSPAPMPPTQQPVYAPTQVPVYYPPPPRKPLLKPETKIFLGRLALTLVLMGAFFALIVVGITTLSKTIRSVQNQNAEQDKLGQISKINPNISVDEQIGQAQALKNQIEDPASKIAADQRIAVMYETQGKQYVQEGDLSRAEVSFQAASDLDKANPAYYSDLAALYESRVAIESDLSSRLILWKQAADSWHSAAQNSTTDEQRKQYGEAYATAQYNYANLLWQSNPNDRTSVRRALQEVRMYAPAGSRIQGDIDAFLQQLR